MLHCCAVIGRDLGSIFYGFTMNPSFILIWNVRGLNQKAHWNSVWDTILSSNADIVCLQETKVADLSQYLFLSVFGSSFDNYIALPANGTRGGVLIAWKGCSGFLPSHCY